MIHTFIPYSIEGNLVEAYEKCMRLIKDDDWALFLDYDVMFTHRNWYALLDKATKRHPEIGIFTCYTNRIRTEFQRVPKIDRDNHNMIYHMNFGKNLYEKNKDSITIFSKEEDLGGFVILIKKSVWNKIKPLEKKGIENIDIEIGRRCHIREIKIARLDGLYAYHWRRGLDEGPPGKLEY